jgi:hypothetical protein
VIARSRSAVTGHRLAPAFTATFRFPDLARGQTLRATGYELYPFGSSDLAGFWDLQGAAPLTRDKLVIL